MSVNRRKFAIVINSPVILGFAGLCLAALVINKLTAGSANHLVFSVYRSSLSNPLTYFRFFGHVLGHADISHLLGNMMFILVLGPMLEERYGSSDILWTIAITALVTGILHFILFPGVALLGASGVVFAFILLASLTGFKQREIPLTFILVAVMYLGNQVYEGLFVADNVSQLTHIVGGIVGAFIGFRVGRRY